MMKKKSPTPPKPLLQMAKGKRTKRIPVWFMRQAGRYLPEYRAVRAKVDFLTLCKTPELAAEVTIQPLRRYDVDASIIFADILLVPTVMGQSLTFDTGHGPHLSQPVRTLADLKKLTIPKSAQELAYVGEAIAIVKRALAPHQTMIGFAGAPFTVASYMIEGQGTRQFTELKKILYGTDARLLPDLMNMIAKVTFDYLKMQVEAGAETLMLFDSWAAEIPGPEFRRVVAPGTTKLIKRLKTLKVPIIYFPGQGASNLSEVGGMDADVISIDWRVRMATAIATLKASKVRAAVQGNLDPQALLGSEKEIRARVRDILRDGQKASGHILNLGHGLLPHTPPESLTWVIDEARRHERRTSKV